MQQGVQLLLVLPAAVQLWIQWMQQRQQPRLATALADCAAAVSACPAAAGAVCDCHWKALSYVSVLVIVQRVVLSFNAVLLCLLAIVCLVRSSIFQAFMLRLAPLWCTSCGCVVGLYGRLAGCAQLHRLDGTRALAGAASVSYALQQTWHWVSRC